MRITAYVGLLMVMLLAGAPFAAADVVTDANTEGRRDRSKLPGHPARGETMAIVHVSVYDSVNAITGLSRRSGHRSRRRRRLRLSAAVLAATRTALSKLVPRAAGFDRQRVQRSPEIRADCQPRPMASRS